MVDFSSNWASAKSLGCWILGMGDNKKKETAQHKTTWRKSDEAKKKKQSNQRNGRKNGVTEEAFRWHWREKGPTKGVIWWKFLAMESWNDIFLTSWDCIGSYSFGMVRHGSKDFNAAITTMLHKVNEHRVAWLNWHYEKVHKNLRPPTEWLQSFDELLTGNTVFVFVFDSRQKYGTWGPNYLFSKIDWGFKQPTASTTANPKTSERHKSTIAQRGNS